MQEYYFETIVVPNTYPEIVADFLLESTGEAIEERDILPNKSLLKNPSYINTSSIPDSKIAFVLYSSCDPRDKLIADLEDFCLDFNQRLNENLSLAYEIKRLPQQDWIQAYKDSITPIKCTKFYIRPSWHSPIKNSIDIVIDPALAFGSGHHASTSMCLEMLSKTPISGKEVLDVGCGSGILSIAAKKLGAKIHCCDSDPFAVSETQKNFTLNALNIDKIWEGSIDKTSHQYDVVIANILADVIILLYNDFARVLKPKGILILSGILEDYKDRVLEVFKDFIPLDILHKDEWISLKLTQNII